MVAGFIGIRVVSLWLSFLSRCSLGFSWVHSCAPKYRGVHYDSRGFSRTLLKVPGSFGFVWVHFGAPLCPRIHWGFCGFAEELVEVAGFIGIRVGSLARA